MPKRLEPCEHVSLNVLQNGSTAVRTTGHIEWLIVTSRRISLISERWQVPLKICVCVCAYIYIDVLFVERFRIYPYICFLL